MLRKFFIKLVGMKKRKIFDTKEIKKIYIDGGRIGDIIVKTPMLEALATINQNIKIDIGVAKGCDSLYGIFQILIKFMLVKKKEVNLK